MDFNVGDLVGLYNKDDELFDIGNIEHIISSYIEVNATRFSRSTGNKLSFQTTGSKLWTPVYEKTVLHSRDIRTVKYSDVIEYIKPFDESQLLMVTRRPDLEFDFTQVTEPNEFVDVVRATLNHYNVPHDAKIVHYGSSKMRAEFESPELPVEYVARTYRQPRREQLKREAKLSKAESTLSGLNAKAAIQQRIIDELEGR